MGDHSLKCETTCSINQSIYIHSSTFFFQKKDHVLLKSVQSPPPWGLLGEGAPPANGLELEVMYTRTSHPQPNHLHCGVELYNDEKTAKFFVGDTSICRSNVSILSSINLVQNGSKTYQLAVAIFLVRMEISVVATALVSNCR